MPEPVINAEPELSDGAAERMVADASWEQPIIAMGFQSLINEPTPEDSTREVQLAKDYGDNFSMEVYQNSAKGALGQVVVKVFWGHTGMFFNCDYHDSVELVRKLELEIARPATAEARARRIYNMAQETGRIRRGGPGHVRLPEAIDPKDFERIAIDARRKERFAKRLPLSDDPSEDDLSRMVQQGEIQQKCVPKGARVRINQPDGQLNGLEGTVQSAGWQGAWIRLIGPEEYGRREPEFEDVWVTADQFVWLNPPMREGLVPVATLSPDMMLQLEALEADDVDPESYLSNYQRKWYKIFVRGGAYFGIESSITDALERLKEATSRHGGRKAIFPAWFEEEVMSDAPEGVIAGSEMTGVVYDVTPDYRAVRRVAEALEDVDPEDYLSSIPLKTYTPEDVFQTINSDPCVDGTGDDGTIYTGCAFEEKPEADPRIYYGWQGSIEITGPSTGRALGEPVRFIDGELDFEQQIPKEWVETAKVRFMEWAEGIRKMLPGFLLGVKWFDAAYPNPDWKVTEAEDFDPDHYLELAVPDQPSAEGEALALTQRGFVWVPEKKHWKWKQGRHHWFFTPGKPIMGTLGVDPNKDVWQSAYYGPRISGGGELGDFNKVVKGFDQWLNKLQGRSAAQKQVREAEAPSAEEIAAAAKEAEPEPSEAQVKAGNYRHGYIKLYGMDIAIENAKGSERSGVDKYGKHWTVKMPSHYGYIVRVGP